MSIKLLNRLLCGVCCCLFCVFLAAAANADVCFLPTGECEAASAKLSSGCGGYNLSEAKDEKGWSCSQCGGKWKCDKKQCKDDYKTDVRCSGTETKVCDETRKAGDESCCKCEDSATKCQHEGYVYKKTSTNENCKNECPYNSDYYESCECNAKYDKSSDADKCYAYNTCELGDLAGTKKYEQTNDVHKCKEYMDNAEYVTEDSEQVKGDYDCALVCTETCDNSNKKYYQCSPKKDCKASEGKYATEEACRASLQHASVFDIFKKYIPNFNSFPSLNVVSTCYAATLDHEACWYCKTDPNPRECYKACSPQVHIDDPVINLCPIDQDKHCVTCRGSCDRQGYPCCARDLGCIGMAMEYDQNCVYCKTDDPTWRAEGCEGYPCCLEEVDKPLLCRINLDKNCALCTDNCDKKNYECCTDDPEPEQPTNSPCELKDGCWVVKETDPCENGPYSWRDTECCAKDKWKDTKYCKKPTCTITAGDKKFTDLIYPYQVTDFVPKVCDDRLKEGLGIGNLQYGCYSRNTNYVLGMIRYCGGINDFAGIDDINALAGEMYGRSFTNNAAPGVYERCEISASKVPQYTGFTGSAGASTLYNKIKSHALGRLDDFWINVRECYNGDESGMVNFFFDSYKYGVFYAPVLSSNPYNLGMCICQDESCDSSLGEYERESDCENMRWSCAKEGNCWKRTNAEITYARSDTCKPVLIVQGSATTVTITPYDSPHKFVDAGNNELTFGLSTGIPSSFKIDGPDGTTTLTATVTGSAGTIGTYNFKAGKSYQITPNCNGGGDDCAVTDRNLGAKFQIDCNPVNGAGKIICTYTITGAVDPEKYKLRVYYHKVNQTQNNIIDLKPNFTGSQQITVGVAANGQTPGGIDKCEIVIQPNDASPDYSADPVITSISDCSHFNATMKEDCTFSTGGNSGYATIRLSRDGGSDWPNASTTMMTNPIIDICGHSYDLTGEISTKPAEFLIAPGECEILYGGAWYGNGRCYKQGRIILNGLETLDFTGTYQDNGSQDFNGCTCHSTVGRQVYNFESGRTYNILVHSAAADCGSGSGGN